MGLSLTAATSSVIVEDGSIANISFFPYNLVITIYSVERATGIFNVSFLMLNAFLSITQTSDLNESSAIVSNINFIFYKLRFFLNDVYCLAG